MTNMTLAIPEELHKIMRKHKHIKWSEVARQAIQVQARRFELMNKILANSKLTEEQSLDLGKKINKGISKKHGLK